MGRTRTPDPDIRYSPCSIRSAVKHPSEVHPLSFRSTSCAPSDLSFLHTFILCATSKTICCSLTKCCQRRSFHKFPVLPLGYTSIPFSFTLGLIHLSLSEKEPIMELPNTTLAPGANYVASSCSNELRSAPQISSTASQLSPPVPQIEPVPNKKASRKRTKTGCLTCRKRRIKCGEERPICNNCIKSKRHCEGYNQRVIFKAPAVDWRSNQQSPASTLQYHGGIIPGRAEYDLPHHTSAAVANVPLTPLRPRPTLDFGAGDEHLVSAAPSSAGLERTSLQFNDPYMPRPSMPAPTTYTHNVPHTTSASFSSLPCLSPLYYTRPIQASHPVATSAEQPIGFKVPVYAQEDVPVSLSPRGTTIYTEEQRTPSSGTTISTFSPGLHSPFMSQQPQMQHAAYRSFSTVDRRSPVGLTEKARIYNNARHHSLAHFDFNTSPWPSNAPDASHFMSPTYSQPEERPMTSSDGSIRLADQHSHSGMRPLSPSH